MSIRIVQDDKAESWVSGLRDNVKEWTGRAVGGREKPIDEGENFYPKVRCLRMAPVSANLGPTGAGDRGTF